MALPTTTMVGNPDADPERPRTGDLAAGDRIGRYVVVGELGRGAMGQVVRARDPQLDRPVAIKVLHRARRGRTPEPARLLREGQALARLSHPNVVAVYEAGWHGERMYVAMELVEGSTLRTWQRGRPWREVVAMYLAAGRGLAAAHGLGLVHRDFKPDNVLVDESGRPRVADFGLARASNDSERGPSDPIGPRTASTQGLLETALTRQGLVMGTPPYIAPDVWQGGAIDARTDQYALCISLYEALFGQRPYSPEDLRRLPLSGEGPTPPDPGEVPGRVVAVVRRGLTPDPARRFATVNDLLDALQAAARPRRWTTPAVATVTLAVLVAATASASDTTCPTPGSYADDLLPARRRSLLAEDAHVDAAALTRLDDAVREWADARHRACTTPGPDPRRADLVASCLDDYGTKLEVGIGLVERGRADAAGVLGAAGRLSACQRDDDGEQRPEPPADLAGAVADLREELVAARFEIRLGAPDLTRETADLLRRAESIGFEPLAVEAQLVHGYALTRVSESAAGIRTLTDTFHHAERIGYDRLAASAGALLVYALAEGSRPQDAEVWARHTRGALERAGGDPSIESSLHSGLAATFAASARFDDAERELMAAIELLERTPGHDEAQLAGLYNNLGSYATARGDHREAVRHYRRTLELRRRVLGEAHVEVGESMVNIASVLYRVSDDDAADDEALRLVREGGRIIAAARGDGYPEQALVTGNEGAILESAGRHEEAAEVFRRALSQAEATLGPDHPDTARTRANLGGSLRLAGRFDEARPLLARAVEDLQEVLGPDDPRVAAQRREYGELLADLGDDDAAIEMFREALRVAELTQGRETTSTATAAYLLGEALRRRGDAEAAIEPLEQAVDGWRVAFGPGSHQHTVALATYGGALLDLGDRERARVALEEADRHIDAIDTKPVRRGRLRLDLARLARADGDEATAARFAAAAAPDLEAGGVFARDDRRALAEFLSAT